MQDYLAAMSCAANYAWVNRSTMTFLVRQAFAKQFKKTPVHNSVLRSLYISSSLAALCIKGLSTKELVKVFIHSNVLDTLQSFKQPMNSSQP